MTKSMTMRMPFERAVRTSSTKCPHVSCVHRLSLRWSEQSNSVTSRPVHTRYAGIGVNAGQSENGAVRG
jgi:hypothetical protein